jgi:tryptophanyl-tRNA synthetase
MLEPVIEAGPMSVRRVLTGISPSGMPHLGNYAGAIRPAIAASRQPDAEGFFFLADYHALITTVDPDRLRRFTLETAAAWLAAGLEPERVIFYRQSDIPEILEVTWLLTCVAPKGLLNRAHAYKAAIDKNTADGRNADAGVSMGLFMYPVLMAADILMFKANSVPVGRDQLQHIEMARDIAARFNHIYGEHFVLPEASIDESVAILPGLDGRKMSKSYGNTIPLFAPTAKLRKLVFSVVTDSSTATQPKDPGTSTLFQLYRAFASPGESAAMRTAFARGISWSEVKQTVFERIDSDLAPMRKRYEELVADAAGIEQRLQEGAVRARAVARPFLDELRKTVGVGRLGSGIAG